MVGYRGGLWPLLGLLLGRVAAGQEVAPVTLAELEALALRNNPTLAQAAALVSEAEGRRLDAGQLPDTTLGYEAEDIKLAAPRETKHSLFFEQRFPAGLGAQRAVRAAELQQMEAQLQAQAQKVVTSVRKLFYRTLAAQEEIAFRQELVAVAREAEITTQRLLNVGQADQPDVLEIALEAGEERVRLQQAESRAIRYFSELAATVGQPDLARAPLAGSLLDELPQLDTAALRVELLSDSPALAMARSRLPRAEAAVRAARAEASPEVSLRGELGYSFHEEPDGSDEGWLASVEIGLALPLFRSTRGAVAAARAERQRAEAELRRVELLLATRFDEAAARYLNHRDAEEQYRTQLLPLAEQSLALSQARFREMTAAYPQVLIARRRLARLRVEHNRLARELRDEAALLQGMLLSGGLDPPSEPSAEIQVVPTELRPEAEEQGESSGDGAEE